MLSVEDGVITVPGDAPCAEVEQTARPGLFSADRPDLTVAEWIGLGGGDLLWGLLGPTRAQVLGIAARLPNGREVRFGGRVVKNVAGYDLARVFVGARGELGEITEAHLRLRPAPRGWRAAVRRDTDVDEARHGPGCAVWSGDTVRVLRRGEPTPDGYDECDPLEARAALREKWRRVRSLRRDRSGANEGILLVGPGWFGSDEVVAPRRGPLWERLKQAWT